MAGVLTRHWNHRDAHRTRVTEDSQDVMFLLETVRAADHELVLEAAVHLRRLLTPHSAAVALSRLTPTERSVALCARLEESPPCTTRWEPTRIRMPSHQLGL